MVSLIFLLTPNLLQKSSHAFIDPPFAMNKMNFNAVLLVQMLREMLCAINRSMLTTGTTKSHLQMTKIAFYKALNMMVYQTIDGLQERQYLTVFLQKINHRLIESGELFILIVLTRVVGTAAIENITSAVSGLIRWDSAFEGERINGNYKGLTLALTVG